MQSNAVAKKDSSGANCCDKCSIGPGSNLPGVSIVLDCQAVLINLPIGIQCSGRSSSLTVGRASTTDNGVLARPPNASGEVSQIGIGLTIPVPGNFVSLISRKRGSLITYLRKPPLSTASLCAALSKSPRWL